MKSIFPILFICATAFAGERVRLEWNKNPEPDVIKYILYQGQSSRNYTSALSTTNTSVTVSNLVSGQTYFFAVTAVNAAGLESDFSAEVSNAIPTKPVSPVILTNYFQPGPLRFELMIVPATITPNDAIQTVRP